MRTKSIFQVIMQLGFIGFWLATLPGCKNYDLPELKTLPASDIKASSALLGGQIFSDGGAEVTSRGICFGTESGPDISGSKYTTGRGTGSFSCTLAGLNQSTLYYARAYATNSEGTGYGEEVQFRTISGSKPEVATKGIPVYFDITAGVKILSDGGLPLTEKGVCLSINVNPTIADYKCISESNQPDPSGFYICLLNKLNPKTTYHIRAYAINACGISYGNDESVTTLAAPEVSTDSVTKVTNNGAIINGNVTSMGDASGMVEIGVCYGTEEYPLYYGLNVKSGTYGPGKFTCSLTNLTPGKLYFVRTYVAWDYDNDWGWFNYEVYGNEVSFKTKD